MTRFFIFTGITRLGTVYSVHPKIAHCNLVFVYTTYQWFNEIVYVICLEKANQVISILIQELLKYVIKVNKT